MARRPRHDADDLSPLERWLLLLLGAATGIAAMGAAQLLRHLARTLAG